MKNRWLAVIGLLLLPSCGPIKPPKPPEPPPCLTCPAGQRCEGGVCVPDPSPPCPDFGVPWCHEAVPPMTCGACKHQPAGESCPIMAPECPPPQPTCPAECPAGTACTDPEAGCVPTPPEPPQPGPCTIPLNGTPVLGAYWHQDRIVDFTPKITNPVRCNLPEVGYPGRQTCPVCDEACLQRGVCEQELIGGPRVNFNCDSPTLKCYDDDGWKVRVAGVGTGTMLACYPNRAACVTLQMTCDAGGCRK